MVEVPVKLYLDKILKTAREATRPTALLSGPVRDKLLRGMATALAEAEESILAANEKDVEAIGKTMTGYDNRERVREAVARVRMTADDVKTLVDRLHRIADLPDPLGEVRGRHEEPNGLQVGRVRVPIGVIGVISEMPPLATIESVALCLKSGNVCLFRGSPDWTQTQQVIGACLNRAAAEAGLPAGALTIIDRPEKDVALELIRSGKALDGIIPRGGPGLRKVVQEQARMPILSNDGGITHVYIDDDVDIPQAQNIVVNAKVQQPSAANALDTLLVHQGIARPLLSALILRLLDEFKIDVHGCPKTVALMGQMLMTGHKAVKPAQPDDWNKQFQGPTMAVKMVPSLDEALTHIAQHGPSHTAVIVTKAYESAMRFAREVDAGTVLVNVSTRLNAGDSLGFGADIGLSAARHHARGPIGLEQLTCEKYIVFGSGQLRQPHPVPLAYEDAIMLKRP
ncbi:MAG: Gamma-glutamyl phosphate reductase [Nitrospirae bacterium]|nr:MAG: gamma-glutamyl phosphate reductase [Nitrospira sp. OLB3]MBV6469198.1 Gamma-glutamyl phosphate reductase [Nitrospirota bacterium]MCE7966831.1 glutamate-5-semialdehyde dehydrogenase [Nitrospira sp. NTP2]MCK6492587.1 glutamate-5-semialdehyde dehydrogenase [Nitrospira sp.]MEB2337743.1 glutamate-5-semialdehyde dehydrogenase [Nitrospirales bacterium]